MGGWERKKREMGKERLKEGRRREVDVMGRGRGAEREGVEEEMERG